jgi:urease gamma subunit
MRISRGERKAEVVDERRLRMADSKPTEETIDKVMAAVLEEARANNTLPELMAATMQKLRERDPPAAHAALRAMIETVAISLPADKRQKFLEELLAFLERN